MGGGGGGGRGGGRGGGGKGGGGAIEGKEGGKRKEGRERKKTDIRFEYISSEKVSSFVFRIASGTGAGLVRKGLNLGGHVFQVFS